jgi:arsenate reductase
MILYIYSKCSTCQKAVRFLEKKATVSSFTIKEITKEPPSLVELQKMLKFQKGNLKKLFNTSGQLYRELGLNDKLQEMSQDEALTLLTQHGMLVKRPFLLGEDFGFTGFKETEWLSLSAG